MRSDTGPFALVPEWVLDLQLSDGAVRLYNVLSLYADRGGSSFPSQRTIAARMGCSDRSVRTYRAELVKAGALRVDERWRDDGGKTTSRYTLMRTFPDPSGNALPVPPRKAASGQELDLDLLEPEPVSTEVLPGNGDAKVSTQNALDDLWDACEEHVQKAPTASSPRKAYAKLVRELLEAGWTPEQVEARARAYRKSSLTGEWPLTLAALAKWGEHVGGETRRGYRVNGNGSEPYQVDSLPSEENARRMRELAASLSGAAKDVGE